MNEEAGHEDFIELKDLFGPEDGNSSFSCNTSMKSMTSDENFESKIMGFGPEAMIRDIANDVNNANASVSSDPAVIRPSFSLVPGVVREGKSEASTSSSSKSSGTSYKTCQNQGLLGEWQSLAIVADFMLVWLPALTISIKAPISLTAGPFQNSFIASLRMRSRLLGACILTIYLVVMYATYVPDWEFTIRDVDSQDYEKVFTVICSSRGRLDPPCNAVGYVDRKILAINHLYKRPAWKRSKACTYDSPYVGALKKDAPTWCQAPFEPEGILSSISAILSTIIGVHFGHVLLHMKNHIDRLKHWIGIVVALLILGLVLHFSHGILLNKQLYSFSYVCVTAGAAAIVFSKFYILTFSQGFLEDKLKPFYKSDPIPKILIAVPSRISSGSVDGVNGEMFMQDTKLWKKRVEHYKKVVSSLGQKGRIQSWLMVVL